jgi:tetratricopeptide (TPR) repeat protein
MHLFRFIMNGRSSLKALVLVLSLLIPSGASFGESVDELMKQGDVYDQKFEPAEALDFYLPAEKQEPDNVSLLLRIARQYRHLMQDAARVSEKLKLGGIAKGYAERAVALAPNEAEAHLSVAISHAKMVPILGTKERLEASKKVKASVDRSIALDPKKDQAWHILGCWHQRLADIGALKRAIAMVVYGGLPAATNEESVKCLQKAIALNPDSPMHHIELGRTYAQMGQTGEARKCIEKGLSMPDVAKDDPEMKRMGRETLGKLK